MIGNAFGGWIGQLFEESGPILWTLKYTTPAVMALKTLPLIFISVFAREQRELNFPKGTSIHVDLRLPMRL
jgi:hypothetical protein